MVSTIFVISLICDKLQYRYAWAAMEWTYNFYQPYILISTQHVRYQMSRPRHISNSN
jgi:hypothetical protein